MTTNNHRPPASPSEAPNHVQTPHGLAVVALVAVAFGVQVPDEDLGRDATSTGDRIVLRSAIGNHPDSYAVFERAIESGGRWHRVTGDLTAAELVNWSDHRQRAGCSAGAFEVWLDRVAGLDPGRVTTDGADGAKP